MPAMFLVVVNRGHDYVGDVTFDFGSRGRAIFHNSASHTRSLCMLFIVSSPFLRSVRADPAMRCELVDNDDVAGRIRSVSGVYVALVESVDELTDWRSHVGRSCRDDRKGK